MSDLSLGIIEVIGLAGAIEMADICLKSANVKLVGYELTKGDGMAVVKIEGNVGDVKAAIEASKLAVSKGCKVFGYKIIPRPSDEIEFLVRNKETIGFNYLPYITKDAINYDSDSTDIDNDFEAEDNNADKSDNNDEDYNIKETDLNLTNDNIDINGDTEIKYTCNLCKDPNCPRRKGELRSTCIHFNLNKKNMTQEE